MIAENRSKSSNSSLASVLLSDRLGHVSRYRSKRVQKFCLQSGLGDHDVDVDL